MMFVDIVGSTTLASRLDPEEMLDVIQRYQRGVAGVVEHAGGHVVKYLGDGVLACFGFPTAHEDAPSRAIRAALEAVARVQSQAHAVPDPSGLGPLAIRVGVASGLVVVGRQTGDDAFETVTVVGEAVNVAARLQDLAEPNQILATAATRRLAAEPFRWRDLGERRLKGMSEPVAVHAVIAATSTARRTGLRAATVPPILVGRDHELDRLLGAWEAARAGATRVVVVSGEPGIGKSALVRAFLRRTAHVPRRRLRFRCAPQEQETALHPHRVQLEQGAGWRTQDPPAVKLDRLERLIALAGARDPEHVALLAALLSIPTDARYPPLTMAPQRQLQRTLEALYAQLPGLAARSPVVVVYEDVHWIDPTSLQLLTMLVERRPALPVLVMVTTRHADHLAWHAAEGVDHLPLAPLGRADSRGLAGALAVGGSLPASVLDRIAERGDGVPLFVEEITKMMLEREAESADDGVTARPIPDTVQDLLAARLDRLGPAKRVAQVAAALGREFAVDHLAAIVEGVDRAGVEAALDQLVRAELVARRTGKRAGVHVFRHALIQDAAYTTMLRRTRQRLHARIGEVLAASFPDLAESEPQIVARHFTSAAMPEQAVGHWLAAARQSARRGVLREAVAYYRHGLEAVAALADGPSRREVEFQLHAGLGPTLMVMSGPGHPEFGRVQTRALELCEELGIEEAHFPLSFGLCVYRWGHAELAAASAMADQLIARAGRDRVDAFVMAANTVGTMVALHQGELALASRRAETVRALYDPDVHRPLYDTFLLDFGVFSSFYLALATLLRGRPERARTLARETLDLARRIDRPHPYGFALLANLMVATWREEPLPALAFADECIAFSTEQGFPEFVALARIARAWARGALDTPAASLDELREGIELWRATGFETWQSWFGVLLARALFAGGDPAAAVTAIDTQLVRVAESGEELFMSDLLATKAAIVATEAADGPAAAVRLYEEAVRVAEMQGAHFWELRALAGLTALAGDGAARAAHGARLRRLLAGFDEGVALPALSEARRVLGE